jgi:hypothetical protein
MPDEMTRHSIDGGVIGTGKVTADRPFDFDDTRSQIRQVSSREWRIDRLLNRYHHDIGPPTR